MQERSVAGVVILSIVTCGIYALYWHVATKSEMVEAGADIPTAWLLIVPIANIYWLWKWGGGIEHVTRGKLTAPVVLLLAILLPLISMAIVQDALNQAIRAGLPGQLPTARAL
jgi:hypothetical protein